MAGRKGLWSLLFALAFLGAAFAGEKAKEDDDKGDDKDVVAKVDTATITRGDLRTYKRLLLALGQQVQKLPNNEQLLDAAIDRILWEGYFEKKELLPTGAQVERAIKAKDAELRRSGKPGLEAILAHFRIASEDYAAYIRLSLAQQNLARKLLGDIKEEDIRKEYDASPPRYDGSRVHISEVFVSTTGMSANPEELDEAKKKIDKCYAALEGGKDFARVAEDHSEGATAAAGGDIGWSIRRVHEDLDTLMDAAWDLPVGKYTKPIRTSRGWFIWKVMEREPAYLTYFGCKRGIKNELLNRKVKSIIKDLRDKAKIEKSL